MHNKKFDIELYKNKNILSGKNFIIELIINKTNFAKNQNIIGINKSLHFVKQIKKLFCIDNNILCFSTIKIIGDKEKKIEKIIAGNISKTVPI